MRKFQHHKNSTLQRIFQVSSRRDTIKYKCNAQIQIVARFRAPFFRAPPRMGRKIPAAWSAAAGCFRRVDVGIDPYGAKWETGTFSPDTRGFSNTLCRGGRLCPPSKFVDFPWPFVGADAHIGPSNCCEFASVFHKTEQFRRADRVVRPYGVEWKTNADSPENRHKTGVSCGSMWASTPTVRNGKRGDFPPDQHDFSRASVGADDSVRPRNSAIFAGRA